MAAINDSATLYCRRWIYSTTSYYHSRSFLLWCCFGLCEPWKFVLYKVIYAFHEAVSFSMCHCYFTLFTQCRAKRLIDVKWRIFRFCKHLQQSACHVITRPRARQRKKCLLQTDVSSMNWTISAESINEGHFLVTHVAKILNRVLRNTWWLATRTSIRIDGTQEQR